MAIVSHNGPEWLQRCLTALLVDARPSVSFEVVVVDSASQAATRRVLESWADQVTLILSDENIGFARGCNLALRAASGRLVLLLNPDAVVHPGCVDNLVTFLDERQGAGIVGGRTLRPDGTVDPSSCWARSTLWSHFCFATGLSSVFRRSAVFDPESMGRWPRDTVREVDIVTGCLLMTSRSTWDELGGLDETYFMYGEDADLCLRAARLGLRPAITPAAVAVHAVGASSGRKPHKTRLVMTGKATLVRKAWAPARASTALALLLAGVALRASGEVVRRPEDPVWRPLLVDRTWLSGWPERDASRSR